MHGPQNVKIINMFQLAILYAEQERDSVKYLSLKESLV